MEPWKVTRRERHTRAWQGVRKGVVREVVYVIVGGLLAAGAVWMWGEPGSVPAEFIIGGAALAAAIVVPTAEYLWRFLRAPTQIRQGRLAALTQSATTLAVVKQGLRNLSLRGKDLRAQMFSDHPDLTAKPVYVERTLPTYPAGGPYEDVVPWLNDCKGFIERELGANEARRLTDPFGDIWDKVEGAGWNPTSVYSRLHDVASHLDDLATTITDDDLATQSGTHT